MNFKRNFSVGIHTLVALICGALPLSVLMLAACLSGCGGSSGSAGSGSSSSSVSIRATATTTAQSLTVGTVMTRFSPLTPSGGTTPYIYSYGGTLPTGLSFSTSTGAVTGTPTATYATANVVFSVQDANAVVANTTSTVSFTVGAASPSISATATTTAQSLTVGTAMASFSPLTPSGGAAPYKYSYLGALPAGLNLNPSTGAVTGTPSATYATANVAFSVQDANAVAANTTSTVSFTVVAAPVAITATANTTAQSLTVGTAIASFSPVTPSGGANPYTYSYLGTLPAGLSLDASTGAVTGIPSAPYTAANVYFLVKDANNVVASTTSSVSFTVVAVSPVISATATTTAQSLVVGTAMTSFSPLTTSGGSAPYTYSITSGTLPAGLSLNTTTGAVTGTPTATYAAANVIFSVKDAYNVVASTTSTVSFTVGAAISATADTTAQSLSVGTAMTSFSPLTASGGTASYTYSVSSGTLPTGLSLNASTGAVTGTPTLSYTAANVVFSVKDTNNVVVSTTSTVSFTAGPTGYVYQGGLTWMSVPAALYTWTNASAYCLNTTINGVMGWRQPTQTEMSALYTSGLMNGQGWSLGNTWSSTLAGAGFHDLVGLNSGSIYVTLDTNNGYVSCVR